MPLVQELAGAQAELAAHLATKVMNSYCPDNVKAAEVYSINITQSQCTNLANHSCKSNHGTARKGLDC